MRALRFCLRTRSALPVRDGMPRLGHRPLPLLPRVPVPLWTRVNTQEGSAKFLSRDLRPPLPMSHHDVVERITGLPQPPVLRRGRTWENGPPPPARERRYMRTETLWQRERRAARMHWWRQVLDGPAGAASWDDVFDEMVSLRFSFSEERTASATGSERVSCAP